MTRDTSGSKPDGSREASEDVEIIALMTDAPLGWIMFVPWTDDDRRLRSQWIIVERSAIVDPLAWR